jgi:hypothetical protein
MDQKTGIRSLCDEFFRGYRAEIRLPCPEFRPNSTHKRTLCTQCLPGAIMTEAQADRILKELRTIKVCGIILTVIIALASAKATFNL